MGERIESKCGRFSISVDTLGESGFCVFLHDGEKHQKIDFSALIWGHQNSVDISSTREVNIE